MSQKCEKFIEGKIKWSDEEGSQIPERSALMQVLGEQPSLYFTQVFDASTIYLLHARQTFSYLLNLKA